MKYCMVFLMMLQSAYAYDTAQINSFRDSVSDKTMNDYERFKSLSFLIFSGNATKDDMRIGKDILQWGITQKDSNIYLLAWMNSVLTCQQTWKEKEYTTLLNKAQYSDNEKDGVKRMFYTIRKKVNC